MFKRPLVGSAVNLPLSRVHGAVGNLIWHVPTFDRDILTASVRDFTCKCYELSDGTENELGPAWLTTPTINVSKLDVLGCQFVSAVTFPCLLYICIYTDVTRERGVRLVYRCLF